MRTFTINGKVYNAKPFTYNLVCDMEHDGVSMSKMSEMPMEVLRVYFMKCSNLNAEKAGTEIEEHIIGGGNLEEIMTVMSSEMSESRFFQSLTKREAKEVTPNTKETTKKK